MAVSAVLTTHVVEAMADAVLVVGHDGEIVLANAALARLSEYSRAELARLPVARLLVDDDRALHTGERRRIEGGGLLASQEGWLVTRSGARIPVSITGSPVHADDGSPFGVVLVAHDQRELRRLLAERDGEIARRQAIERELAQASASIESQLETTREQLLLAERRATLGTLAGGVGHVLRNIAQVQLLATGELGDALRRGVAEAELAALVETVMPDLGHVADHITQHARRLLQLAKPGPEHAEALELHEVIDEVIAMLRGAGRLRDVVVRHADADRPAPITVNRARIEQILVNLLVNALEAIDGHGTITIAVTAEAARVVTRIADTGRGIAPDALARVFEPFYTTKSAAGAGLGLTVVREIVTSFGGTVELVSTVGRGTTVRFDLPWRGAP